VIWLGLVPPGSRAVVSSLPAARGLAKRLIALGVTPGAEVRVLQNRGRGPLIVEVHGCRLALGRGQAMRVGVEPVAESAEVLRPADSAEARGPVCLSDLGETGRET
jgi:ferrous iron transport protein A